MIPSPYARPSTPVTVLPKVHDDTKSSVTPSGAYVSASSTHKASGPVSAQPLVSATSVSASPSIFSGDTYVSTI